MPDWTYLTPEICPHGVDQRYHSYVDEEGWTHMTRNWCTQCLASIDVRAALNYVATHDIKIGDD